MISSVKAKLFFVECMNVNARLTSILIIKKSRSWGGGGVGEIYFSPHLLSSDRFLPQGLIYPLSPIFLSGKRELKERRRWRQRERQKRNRLHWQNNSARLFCTFLCRRCTSVTWICLISRFVEDVNTRRRLPFSFRELRYREFNSRKNSQRSTNWMRWNKRDKGWSSANSLCKKWRFCSRCRRCFLTSLKPKVAAIALRT